MNPSLEPGTLDSKNYFSLIRSFSEYIKKNNIAPGERLPEENTLAHALHTSRPTLREVLRVLEVLGVITSIRGSGNLLICNPEVGYTNVSVITALMRGDNSGDCASIRATIESAAIEEFIQFSSQEDIRHLEDLYGQFLHAEVLSELYLEKHIEFHLYLLKYYSNKLAASFLRSNIQLISADAEQAIAAIHLEPDARRLVIEEINNFSHEKILDAIRSRDVTSARELIRHHVLIPAMVSKITAIYDAETG